MQFILCKYQFEVNSIRSQSQLLEVGIYNRLPGRREYISFGCDQESKPRHRKICRLCLREAQNLKIWNLNKKNVDLLRERIIDLTADELASSEMLEGCRWPFPHTKPRQTLQTLADVHSKIPFTFSYLRNNERKYNSASIYFQTPSKRRISTIWGPCAFLNLNKVPFRKKEGKVPCIITFNLFMNLERHSGPKPKREGRPRRCPRW